LAHRIAHRVAVAASRMRPELSRGSGALRHAISSAFPRALCTQSETVEMRICRLQAEILEHIPSPTHVQDLGQQVLLSGVETDGDAQHAGGGNCFVRIDSNRAQMHLLTCKHELWRRSLRECPFPEPWWAFLWPGGFALTKWCARHARHLRGALAWIGHSNASLSNLCTRRMCPVHECCSHRWQGRK
jgi:hypothetical protein